MACKEASLGQDGVKTTGYGRAVLAKSLVLLSLRQGGKTTGSGTPCRSISLGFALSGSPPTPTTSWVCYGRVWFALKIYPLLTWWSANHYSYGHYTRNNLLLPLKPRLASLLLFSFPRDFSHWVEKDIATLDSPMKDTVFCSVSSL